MVPAEHLAEGAGSRQGWDCDLSLGTVPEEVTVGLSEVGAPAGRRRPDCSRAGSCAAATWPWHTLSLGFSLLPCGLAVCPGGQCG